MSEIIQGDCLEVLKTLPADSVDLVCTDPPYGIGFMGKEWDTFKPEVLRRGVEASSRKSTAVDPSNLSIRERGSAAMESARYDHTPSGARKFREWFTGISVEMLRVMKPGAFAFVCIGARQDSVSATITAMTEAGFKTDFTSIFWTYASGFPKAASTSKTLGKRNADPGKSKALEGSYAGFQPKPAVEIIIVAMKPLSEGTFTDQALKNGKGITWLDDARIPTSNASDNAGRKRETRYIQDKRGRFPANLIVSDQVLDDGANHKSGSVSGVYGHSKGFLIEKVFQEHAANEGGYSRFFDLDAWWLKALPFLIVAKAGKGEKNKGMELLEKRTNHHPTVKPIKLMSYLITLGSRPRDVVLDPFLGSGTTAVAAKQLGREYIGIEREQEYCEIAEARISAISKQLTFI